MPIAGNVVPHRKTASPWIIARRKRYIVERGPFPEPLKILKRKLTGFGLTV